jgi:glutamyl-Q tRNA(Asp) synthetase
MDDEAQGYPGTCRHGPTQPGPTASRFRVSDHPIHFDDQYIGPQHFDLAACGDVIVQRRDGLASYQLAVVVDDAFQAVTRVVRGADLLTSTPWQIDLQNALGVSTPIYGHLPLLLEPEGAKLSKSRRSLPVDRSAIPQALVSTLTHLSQTPPRELVHSSIKDVWKWALEHWSPQALAGRREVRLSAAGGIEAESKRENCGVPEGVLR